VRQASIEAAGAAARARRGGDALPDLGPSRSLWRATAPAGPPCPPLVGEAQADLCIVGAGFTGLSAALRLAEDGAAVTVLDAGEPGWGASGRNGGMVLPGLRIDPEAILARWPGEAGERIVALVGGVCDTVAALVARHRIDCALGWPGWIQAAHSHEALATLERRAAQWQRRGAPVSLLDRTETAALLGTALYRGALLDRRGGAIQPLAYARGLAAAALARGARLHGGTLVERVERIGEGWRVAAGDGAVLARQVLVCTNGYAGLAAQLWPRLARSVVPFWSYIVATRPLGPALARQILPQGHVASDTRRLLAYFRTDPQGRLLMGGPGKLTDGTGPRLYRYVMAGLRELYPASAALPVEFAWGGRVAVTLDRVPHLHELAPGLYAGLGYNGRGIAMSTTMGLQLAALASGRAAEVVFPPAPLRTVPFHGLRVPVGRALIAWERRRDRREMRRG
jgi:sarcosine oxidase